MKDLLSAQHCDESFTQNVILKMEQSTAKLFFFEKKFVRNKDIWKKKYSMKEQLFNQLSRGETTVL